MSKEKNSNSEYKRLIKEVPKVFLDPLLHEINEHPKNVKVHFIDSKWMPAFEPFLALSQRTVKLVNWGKPAINLTFFEKHKYIVHREPDLTDIEQYLQNKLDELRIEISQTRLFDEELTERKKKAISEEMQTIQQVLAQFHDFDFAMSNYYRNYTYWYVNWRWIKADGSHDYGQEHLLKDENDFATKSYIQKENIIFVDMDRIGEHTPYQSKKVEEFLTSFLHRVDIGTHDIFIKPKNIDLDKNNLQ